MTIRGGSLLVGNLTTGAVPVTGSASSAQNLSDLAKTFSPIVLPQGISTPATSMGARIPVAITQATNNPTNVATQFGVSGITLGARLPVAVMLQPVTIASVTNRVPSFRIPTVRPNRPMTISPDSLHVADYTINNGQYQPISLNGICSFRPEIVLLMDYNNLYNTGLGEYSSEGKMVALNYESGLLRANVVQKMVKAIADKQDPDRVFPVLNSSKSSKLNSIEQTLTFLNANLQQINNAKKAFDIKHLTNDHYDTSRFLTLEEFFEKKMKYDRRAYESFSDTKVLYQLVFDLRSMMEKYSLSLLDSIDSDRGLNDLNPITIDRTYADDSNFSFTIQSNSAKFPYTPNEFSSFGNSLPSNVDDKIKLLIATLAKELRVSRGLAEEPVRALLQGYFGGNADGNPFDNVVGTVGSDIFESPQGTNSLASLFQVKGSNSTTVLPFERKTVDDNQTSYVPGTRYFADSILELDQSGKTPRFSTQALTDYVARYSDVLANVKLVLDELFQINSKTTSLRTNVVYNDFALSLRHSLSSLASSTQNTDQAIFLALFRLAGKDSQLKLMLFQYLLLLGLVSNEPKSEKKVFIRFATELTDLKNLSFVKVGASESPDIFGGVYSLSTYLKQLCADIETRALELINQKLSQKLGVSINTFGTTNSTKDSGLVTSNTSRAAAEFASQQQPGANIQNQHDKVVRGDLSTDSTLGASGDISDSETKIFLNPRAISNTLETANNVTTTNLAKELLSLSSKLDAAASDASVSRTYLLGDDAVNRASSTLTRFNQLSTTTLLLFMFETMFAFTSKYFSADFVSSADPTRPSILQDQTKNSYMLGVLEEIAPETHLGATTFGARLPSNRGGPPTATPVSSNTVRSITQTVFGGVHAALFVNAPSDQDAATAAANAAINAATSLLFGTPAPAVTVDGTRVGGAGEAVPAGYQDDTESLQQLGRTGIGSVGTLLRKTSSSQTDLRSVLRNQALFSLYTNLRHTALNIGEKLSDEDKTVQNCLHILEVIGDNLNKVKSQTLSYFTQASTSDILRISDIKNRLTPSQIRLANWLLFQNKTILTEDMYGVQGTTTDSYNMLLSLLRESPYTKTLSNKRTKLLVVGIPFGFADKLIERIPRSSIGVKTDLEQLTEAELVNIVVWKKTAENDDIVFQPQKFVFDLSLFPNKIDNIDIDPSVRFDSLLSQLALLDYSSDLDIEDSGKTIDQTQLGSSARWQDLSSEQKQDLFRNHVVSQLLTQYLSLSTGLNTAEDTFPLDGYGIDPFSTQLSPEGLNLVNSYLSSVKNLSKAQIAAIQNMDFSDPTLDQSTVEDVRLLRTAPLLQLDLVEQKILSPKKFDRVFVVPVDIDAFVVDEPQTKTTISGKKAIAKTDLQQKLVRAPTVGDFYYIDRSSDPNALVFDELFVSVETIK